MDPKEDGAASNELKGVLEGGRNALLYYSKGPSPPFFNLGNLII